MHTTYQVSDYSLDSLGFILSHRSEVVCGAHTGMTDRVCVTKTQSVSQQKSTQIVLSKTQKSVHLDRYSLCLQNGWIFDEDKYRLGVEQDNKLSRR